jgi:hypothetical protein
VKIQIFAVIDQKFIGVVIIKKNNHYLINFYQTIQIIEKGDFWGKNRQFLALQF